MTIANGLGRSSSALLIVALVIVGATPAFAGEITGNGSPVEVHGNSLCAYSGINDTPNGLTIEVAPGVFIQVDPGGRTQSYGSFYAHYDFVPSPQDPASRDAFAFPGFGCNPNRSTGH